MFQARQNEPSVRQPTKTAPAQTLSRACQAGHLKTTTPGSQTPMARQREHAAFQNTAPAQRNNTSSLRSYDSRTGSTKKTAHRKSSNSRVLRFPTERAIAQSYERLRTAANGCGRLHNIRRTRLHPETPKMLGIRAALPRTVSKITKSNIRAWLGRSRIKIELPRIGVWLICGAFYSDSCRGLFEVDIHVDRV